ncbi:MAG: hypothetical protein H5T99_10675 [Moorella sp. (in: Bacteria)]|nr:hypothetical protein [Moorella sp. (in: firmicutes)]
MEAGQVQIKKEPVVLPPVIQRVVARCSPVAKEKGVTLAYFCRDNLPSVAGDADRLEQVLNNLVDNAVRYTPAGGKISIAAEPAPGGAQVTVSDTGPGVPEEELPLIWERFYKADKARLRSGAGSGLGLAIARQIIELHGGTIEAKSRPGEGTSFTFHLPLFRSEKL